MSAKGWNDLPDDTEVTITRTLRPFKLVNAEGPCMHGYFIDSDLADTGCEGCGDKITSGVYVATWTQGERGMSPSEPDTMVINECLPCFVMNDWTREVKMSEPFTETKKVRKGDVKLGVWGEW